MMMAALSTYHAGVRQVVLVGRRDGEDLAKLTGAVAREYLPFAVTVVAEPGAHQHELARSLPFIASMTPLGGRAAAYVCRGFVCERPVTSADQMVALVRATDASTHEG